jgi:hypothetical protein
MTLPRRRFIGLAAATLSAGACVIGWPTGDTVAHAAARMQSVTYPWSKTDDEIVVNLAIGSLRDSLMKWLTTERGVNVENLFASIGAIAGFAAQNAALARMDKRDVPLPVGADKTMSRADLSEHLREKGLLLIAATKDGEHFYFGDLINGYLVEQATTVDYSLFSIVAGAALAAGLKTADLPDYKAMFAHVASTVGQPSFGELQLPAGGPRPGIGPRKAIELFWPHVKFIFERTDGQKAVTPAVGRNVKPEYWPLVSALVAGQLIAIAKDTIDPKRAVALIMESAIIASKIDPKTVPQAPSGKSG